MKLVIAVMVLLFGLSCGPLKVEGDPDKPIVVEHKVNLKNLEKYFRPLCVKELPANATEAEIADCVDGKIGEFLEAIGTK